MKFTIDKNVYSGALDKVKRAVSKSDDDETLKFIYHEAGAKGLRLLATDGNIHNQSVCQNAAHTKAQVA